MAILPVSLCKCIFRRCVLCFPIGKCLFAVLTFIIFLDNRKQASRQRFKDVFRNFGRIKAVLNICFFCVHTVPYLSLL